VSKTPVNELIVGTPVAGVAKINPIIVADNVSRRFGGLTAVNVDHVEIPANAITTLFNLLTGFDQPNTGKWTFKGQNLAGVPAYRVARRGMVRTFQLTKALSLMTVLDNMLLGATKQPGENMFRALIKPIWRSREDEITTKALALLEKFKLDTKKEDYAASLSGGQRKLLEMARALMSDPDLVMLDEPMAGVNPALTQSLLHHIQDLKALGMTVLFVEHDMHVVQEIADWVIVMAEGKIVAEGPPASVMSDPAVIDAYLGAHHDTDLGTLAGQQEIAKDMDSELIKHDLAVEEEAAHDAK
jgi:neutral amino acid transport system ATP-binding protein